MVKLSEIAAHPRLSLSPRDYIDQEEKPDVTHIPPKVQTMEEIEQDIFTEEQQRTAKIDRHFWLVQVLLCADEVGFVLEKVIALARVYREDRSDSMRKQRLAELMFDLAALGTHTKVIDGAQTMQGIRSLNLDTKKEKP